MELAIVGAGGHGRELAEIARAANNSIEISFWDDGLEAGDFAFGAVCGGIDDLFGSTATHFLVGIGHPRTRAKVVANIVNNSDLVAFTAVHPTATVGARCEIAPGCVIGPSTVLTCDVSVADHSHLHSNVVVAHDCAIGKYVVITPGVSIAGDVTIGDLAWLGVGSTVNRGIRIGTDSLVGAGAVVISDVDAGDVVAGVPARSLDPSTQR